MANIWKKEILETKSITDLLALKSSVSKDAAKSTTKMFRTNLINGVLKDKGYNVNVETKSVNITDNIAHDLYIANAYSRKVENARSRGIAFNLTLGQFKTLYRRKKCYYTGVTMVNGGGVDNPSSRTLDRIDNNKGYIPGNVVCCTNSINKIKNELFERPDGCKARLVDVAKLVKKLEGL